MPQKTLAQFLFLAVVLVAGSSNHVLAATYNYSAVTDICGAGGLTTSVAVGDVVRISDTQTTCTTGNITAMANRGNFTFIADGSDYIAQVTTTTSGIGTVVWTDGSVFSITVIGPRAQRPMPRPV